MSERIYMLPNMIELSYPSHPDQWTQLVRGASDVLDLAEVLARVAEDIRDARRQR